ncbi:MAG: tetratricopeptide repeat protein, partial [Planctomycetes bacterium]|nr:tetratricopeptide repeat protein [Planctomycetota bacterium]
GGLYPDLPFAGLGLLVVLALGLLALGPAAPPEAAPPTPVDSRDPGWAALACLRLGGVSALAGGMASGLAPPRPWLWAAGVVGLALLGAAVAGRWSRGRRLALEAVGWLAAAGLLSAWALSPPALALLVACGALTAGASARAGLERSLRPLLAVIAGALLGGGLAPAAYRAQSATQRAQLALGAPHDEALSEGVASGLVRERYAAGGYAGVQVVDVGGDKPVRLLTSQGRVLEALPQRRGVLPELLRARAVAAALAAWLAPGERLLVAGVGSGYGASLLQAAQPRGLQLVEPSAGIAGTWTEPGDVWGLYNGRLGDDPRRLAEIARGPLHPQLLHGRFDAVLFSASPSPASLGAALRHPVVVGPLTLSAGVAELRAWTLAERLLVFRPLDGEVRVVVAGPAQLSWTRLREGWDAGGPLRAELERLGISSPAQLVASLEGGGEAARLALRSPDPAGTLARAGAEQGPSLVCDADGAALIAITERVAAAGSPATLRWARAAVEAERSAPALATLGALLLNSGDPEQGRAQLRAALELDPAHDPARLQLAFDLQRGGAPDDAEALLRAGLRQGGAQASLHHALAKLAEARDDPRAALEHYEAAGETGDAPERARELRATLQREHALGTRVKAAYALLGAAERGEADAAQGLELALALAEADLEREDRLLLARTLDGFAKLEPMPLLRANLQRHRAQVLAPLSAEPRLALRAAEAWLAGERPAEALALLEPLCGEDAQRPQALRLLGDALALRGETEPARDAYRRALALGPALTTNGPTYEQLARLQAREGDLAGALELLGDGDRALGGVPRLRLTRGELLEAVGRDAEARAAYEAYLEVAPPSPERRAVEARLGH